MLSEVLNFFWPSGDGYQRSLNLTFYTTYSHSSYRVCYRVSAEKCSYLNRKKETESARNETDFSGTVITWHWLSHIISYHQMTSYSSCKNWGQTLKRGLADFPKNPLSKSSCQNLSFSIVFHPSTGYQPHGGPVKSTFDQSLGIFQQLPQRARQ